MEELLLRNRAVDVGDRDGGPLTAPLTEMLIERLQPLTIEEIASPRWIDQKSAIEKLNLQAHHNARTHSDEFVVQYLTRHNKIATLIHELLVVEVNALKWLSEWRQCFQQMWKDKVFPLLKSHFCRDEKALSWYFVLHHEVTLANLIEICFFEKTAFEELEDDYLLEIIMWCHRQCLWLNHHAYKTTPSGADLRDLLNQSPEEELSTKLHQIQFSAATCSLTILRYIAEDLSNLPLCVMSCLMRSLDIVMALLPLIDSPPWIRTINGKLEKYIDNAWVSVAKADRFRICQLEGQVWLSLTYLLTDSKCYEVYPIDDFRREKILSIRKHFNERLFDQLPILKDLERAIDILCLQSGSDQTETPIRAVLLEQIPSVRQEIGDGRDWNALAARQKRDVFSDACERLSTKQMEDMIELVEYMCQLEDGEANAAPPSTRRRERIWIEARRCARNTSVWERVMDFSLDVDLDASFEVIHVASRTGESHPGRRYVVDVTNPISAPLPSEGKLVVSFEDRTIEARLTLPTASAKIDDVPKSIWVTVGSLSSDTFALQLQLKRLSRTALWTKDKDKGYWDAYQPVRAAITIAVPKMSRP